MVPLIPTLAQLTKIPFTFIILMMLMVLLLGGQTMYGEQATSYTVVLFIYIIMLLAVRSDVPKTEHKPKTIFQAIPVFGVAFFITFFLAIGIANLIPGVLIAATVESAFAFSAVFGIMLAFVKSYIEEEVFRGRLSTVMGEAGQAIAFGLFHSFILFGVFGFGPRMIIGLIWLAILGFIWGFVENAGGVEASTGSHFGYNLVVFGMAPFVTGAFVIV